MRISDWSSDVCSSDLNGLHNALISPADVLDVASAALPSEDNDDALSYTLPFLTGKTVALSGDPRAALETLHAGCRSLLERAAAASTVQLAAFQGAVDTATDTELLNAWLATSDLPRGVEIDDDLRWRILVRLACLDAVDRDDLDRQLAEHPSTKAGVDHAQIGRQSCRERACQTVLIRWVDVTLKKKKQA